MTTQFDTVDDANTQVSTTWLGAGGVLDSVNVKDDGDMAVTNALIQLVRRNIVSAGDTFKVRSI